jgi:ABC-type Zn2+ transport system substrate-binding protein/surface adhesin
MVGEVARRKGLAVVLEQATITDANGERVDLDDLVPPRPGEEQAEAHDHDHDHDHDHEGHGHGHGHSHDEAEDQQPQADEGDASVRIPTGDVELDDDES